MKNIIKKYTYKRLTAAYRVWHNFTRHLKKLSNNQLHTLTSPTSIREELMADLKQHPDRRSLISLPGIPE